MRRWVLPGIYGIAVYCLSLYMLFSHDTRFSWSATGATAIMMNMVPIIWGLGLGFGAGDGTTLRRSLGYPLLLALPAPSRVLAAMRRILGISLGMATGLFLACITGVVIAWWHGSVTDGRWLVPVALASLGSVAAVALGWWLGVTCGQWILVPLPAAAMIIAFALHFPGLDSAAGIFLGSSDVLVTMPISPMLAVLTALMVIAAGVFAYGLLRWWAHERALAWVMVSVTVFFAAYMGAGSQSAAVFPNTARWPCRDLPTGNQVCTVPDQEYSLQEIASGVEPLDQQLSKLDHQKLRWLPNPGDGTSQSMVYSLPLGAPFDAASQAQSISGAITQCQSISAQSDAESEQSFRDFLTLLRWMEPSFSLDAGMIDSFFDGKEPGPVSQREAQEAYRRARAASCDLR